MRTRTPSLRRATRRTPGPRTLAAPGAGRSRDQGQDRGRPGEGGTRSAPRVTAGAARPAGAAHLPAQGHTAAQSRRAAVEAAPHRTTRGLPPAPSPRSGARAATRAAKTKAAHPLRQGGARCLSAGHLRQLGDVARILKALPGAPVGTVARLRGRGRLATAARLRRGDGIALRRDGARTGREVMRRVMVGMGGHLGLERDRGVGVRRGGGIAVRGRGHPGRLLSRGGGGVIEVEWELGWQLLRRGLGRKEGKTGTTSWDR